MPVARRRWLVVLLVLFLIGTYLYWRIVPQPAETYAEHSRTLQVQFNPEHNSEREYRTGYGEGVTGDVPRTSARRREVAKGYDAFSMIVEPGMDRPIGFSKRRVLEKLISLG